MILLVPLTLLAQRPVPVDNEWARAIVATTAPGPKGRMHKHDMNRVMIYLDKGAQTIEYEGGASKIIAAKAGEVQWDPKGGMHTSMNSGGTTFRIVEIELKKDGGPVTWPKADPLKVAPKIYTVEFENDQVRVVRVKLGAHQKIAEHEHAVPRIVVPLTEVDMALPRLTEPPGRSKASLATRSSANRDAIAKRTRSTNRSSSYWWSSRGRLRRIGKRHILSEARSDWRKLETLRENSFTAGASVSCYCPGTN
jgi:quercetin dioxygenase-like cupin family protein